METLAPERHETSNGFFLHPNFFPVVVLAGDYAINWTLHCVNVFNGKVFFYRDYL